MRPGDRVIYRWGKRRCVGRFIRHNYGRFYFMRRHDVNCMDIDVAQEDIDLAFIYLQEYQDSPLDALLALVQDSGQGASGTAYWLRAITKAKEIYRV